MICVVEMCELLFAWPRESVGMLQYIGRYSPLSEQDLQDGCGDIVESDKGESERRGPTLVDYC